MKRFLLVLAAALALSVPSFADADPYFASSVSAVKTGNSVQSYNYTSTNTDKPCYFFFVDNSGAYLSYAISEYQGATFSVTRQSDNGIANSGSINSTYVYNGSTYYTASNVQGLSNPPSYTITPAISVFPSNATYDDFCAAFETFLSGASGDPVQSSFIVPSGNVLYFKVDREQDVNFSATMPVMSSLLGTPTGAWNSGIEFGPAAALPTSNTTFPILSQDPINFAKSAINQNLLGQTKSALARKHCIAGQYYVLYLPYHYGGWLALGSSHVYSDGSVSGDIVGANVTVSGSFAEIKVYPLSEKANGDLLTGSVTLDSGSDDGFASYYDGEISETGTVTWLNQDGEVSAPSVGGTSYVPEDVSTESIIDQIKNILSSIVSEIKNLFSFGYEAVNTLVGLMRDFVSIFQQLYDWLPSEVYSALISAIIVAITIGVFKVFL